MGRALVCGELCHLLLLSDIMSQGMTGAIAVYGPKAGCLVLFNLKAGCFAASNPRGSLHVQ